MEILVIWLVLSVLVGILGAAFGRGGFLWFLVALILSPLIGVIALLIAGRTSGSKPAEANPNTHVLCPACAEPVRMEASLCKHCGTRLVPALRINQAESVGLKTKLNSPGFKAAIIVAAIVLGGGYLASKFESPTEVAAASTEDRNQTSIKRAEDRKERERLAYVKKLEEREQKERERRQRDCADTIAAFVMSQSFVKRDLRAPSTAKFPTAMSEGVASQSLGDCKFRVQAYVDSQNAFGATVRVRYIAELEYMPDKKQWEASSLRMN